MQRLPTPLGALYADLAPIYERAIGPIMQPLAADLVARAGLRPGSRVLDVGTGTGVLARQMASAGCDVVGVDTSYPMLRAGLALRPSGQRLDFVLADANRLDGFADDSFDAVYASFGLSETDPGRSLRALARVLRPGGQIALQEWGPYSGATDPRWIVDDTLADYAVDVAEGYHADLRAMVAEPRAWDRALQDADDYTDALTAAGFTVTEAAEIAPVTVRLGGGTAQFLTYALAWTPRRLELEAMPDADRQACLDAMRKRLEALLEPDGSLCWAPILFYLNGTQTSFTGGER